MAANMMMDDIEKLNRIILLLEDREFSTAKGIAIVWRDKLQGELDTMNSYYENLEYQNDTLETVNNPYTKGEGI
jgi:hypothetical protein